MFPSLFCLVAHSLSCPTHDPSSSTLDRCSFPDSYSFSFDTPSTLPLPLHLFLYSYYFSELSPLLFHLHLYYLYPSSSPLHPLPILFRSRVPHHPWSPSVPTPSPTKPRLVCVSRLSRELKVFGCIRRWAVEDRSSPRIPIQSWGEGKARGYLTGVRK